MRCGGAALEEYLQLRRATSNEHEQTGVFKLQKEKRHFVYSVL